MGSTASGLSRVSTADLKRLLKALHRELLPSPITRAGLIEVAFGNIEGDLDAVVGRDIASAKALVVCVLAEREAERGLGTTLSVQGPAVAGTRSRDLYEQVSELLATALERVDVVGFPAAGDARLARSLLALVDGRSVRARLVCAGTVEALREALEPRGLLRDEIEVFACAEVALTGRAMVIDRERVLVTSGELDSTEDAGRLDLGVRLDDRAYATALHEEIERLIRARKLTRV